MLGALKSYVQPRSLAWWAGVAMVGTGGAMMAGLDHPAFGQVALLLNMMTGGSGAVVPAQLVFAGLGLIGIRAKLERM